MFVKVHHDSPAKGGRDYFFFKPQACTAIQFIFLNVLPLNGSPMKELQPLAHYEVFHMTNYTQNYLVMLLKP